MWNGARPSGNVAPSKNRYLLDAAIRIAGDRELPPLLQCEIAARCLSEWMNGRLKAPKSNRSRSVKLASSTIQILRQHQAAQNVDRLRLRTAYVDLDLIFPRESGAIWHPDLFGKSFGSVAKRAAIGHVRLHDVRHSCASLMLKSGVLAKVVSERLGHSTIAITLDLLFARTSRAPGGGRRED